MTVGILGDAEREFAESVAYYEAKETGLGWRSRTELVEPVDKIQRNSDLYRLRAKGSASQPARVSALHRVCDSRGDDLDYRDRSRTSSSGIFGSTGSESDQASGWSAPVKRGLLHMRPRFGMDAVALQLRQGDVHAEDERGDQAEIHRGHCPALRGLDFVEALFFFGFAEEGEMSGPSESFRPIPSSPQVTTSFSFLTETLHRKRLTIPALNAHGKKDVAEVAANDAMISVSGAARELFGSKCRWRLARFLRGALRFPDRD